GDIGFVARGALPAKLERTYDTPDDWAVYTNKAALARAFVVGQAEVLDPTKIPGRVAARGFDPRKVVLLERPPPAEFAHLTGDGPPGSATISRYRNLSVDIEAGMDRPG